MHTRWLQLTFVIVMILPTASCQTSPNKNNSTTNVVGTLVSQRDAVRAMMQADLRYCPISLIRVCNGELRFTYRFQDLRDLERVVSTTISSQSGLVLWTRWDGDGSTSRSMGTYALFDTPYLLDAFPANLIELGQDLKVEQTDYLLNDGSTDTRSWTLPTGKLRGCQLATDDSAKIAASVAEVVRARYDTRSSLLQLYVDEDASPLELSKYSEIDLIGLVTIEVNGSSSMLHRCVALNELIENRVHCVNIQLHDGREIVADYTIPKAHDITSLVVKIVPTGDCIDALSTRSSYCQHPIVINTRVFE